MNQQVQALITQYKSNPPQGAEQIAMFRLEMEKAYPAKRFQQLKRGNKNRAFFPEIPEVNDFTAYAADALLRAKLNGFDVDAGFDVLDQKRICPSLVGRLLGQARKRTRSSPERFPKTFQDLLRKARPAGGTAAPPVTAPSVAKATTTLSRTPLRPTPPDAPTRLQIAHGLIQTVHALVGEPEPEVIALAQAPTQPRSTPQARINRKGKKKAPMKARTEEAGAKDGLWLHERIKAVMGAESLSVGEVVERLHAKSWQPEGVDPKNTVSVCLSQNSKKLFERVDRGVYRVKAPALKLVS